MLENPASVLLPVVMYVLFASCKGALAIGLMLSFRSLLKDRLSARVRHRLWLVVTASLILPVGFGVAIKLPVDPPATESIPIAVEAQTAAPAPAARPGTVWPVSDYRIQPTQIQRTQIQPGKKWSSGLSLKSWIALLWMAVVVVLAAVTALNQFRYRRIASRALSVSGPARDLLVVCGEQMGLRRPVRLLESGDISSPALFGWRSPVLLIPQGLQERFDATQLRHVFLHELAHVRRHDILVSWCMTCVQILHWFNPVVWYGLRVMRSDMEQACDARVLDHLSSPEHADYGRTLIGVLDAFPGRTPAHGLGVIDNHRQLKERINMIANFSSRKLASPVLVTSLLLGLATVAATQPKISTESAGSTIDRKPVAAQPADTAVPLAQPVPPAPVQPPSAATDAQRSTDPLRDVNNPRADLVLKFMIAEREDIQFQMCCVGGKADGGNRSFGNLELRQGNLLFRADRADRTDVTGISLRNFLNSTWQLSGNVHMEFNNLVFDTQSARLDFTAREVHIPRSVNGVPNPYTFSIGRAFGPPQQGAASPALPDADMQDAADIRNCAAARIWCRDMRVLFGDSAGTDVNGPPPEQVGAALVLAAFRAIVDTADSGRTLTNVDAMRSVMLRSLNIDPADLRVSLAGLRRLMEERNLVSARAVAALCAGRNELVTGDAFQDAMLKMKAVMAAWEIGISRDLKASPPTTNGIRVDDGHVSFSPERDEITDYRPEFREKLAAMCPDTTN